MRKMLAVLQLLIGISVSTMVFAADLVVTKDLGLSGCEASSMASTADGAMQFVTCSMTPKPLYVSSDFGGTWSPVDISGFSSPVASYVETSANAVYVISARNIYRSTLVGAGANWTPTWTLFKEDALGTESFYYMKASGSLLFVAGFNSGFRIFNGVDGALVQQKDLVDADVVALSSSYKTIAVDTGAVYLSVYSSFGNGLGRIYKATFNGSQLTSEWTALAALPQQAGATEGSLDTPLPSAIYLAPNHKLYALSYRTSTYNYVWGIFESTNEGTSFTKISTSDPYATSACFNGNTFVLGSNLSTDGGATWQAGVLANGQSESGSIKMKKGFCLFYPSDANSLLMASWRGVARTAQLGAAGNVWSDANTGLAGVNVQEMAQFPSNKGRVVLATSSGLATTNNFTDSKPTWDWSCPENNCENTKRIAADSVDPTRFYVWSYVGAKIYSGTFADGHFTWTSLMDLLHPTDNAMSFLYANSMHTYSFLPGKLVVGFGDINGTTPRGGVYFVNTADGTVAKKALDGTPIMDAVALDKNVMYAVAGHSLEANPTSYARGIYRSTDGGDHFTQVSDATSAANLLFKKLSYDAGTDTLWAIAYGANGVLLNIYYAENASKDTVDWKKVPDTYSAGWVTVGINAFETDGNGSIFVATSTTVRKSTDKGATWTILSQGVVGETINTLFFDELVVGSNTGARMLTETKAAVKCTLKTPGYNGKAVRMPRIFTFALTYTGQEKRGTLQVRKAGTRTWQKLQTLKISKGKSRAVRAVSRTAAFRVVIKGCTTSAVTLKRR